MAVRIINLEAGMPPAEFAKSRLIQELYSARSSGTKVVKIIHGYGSTGKGGAIKTMVLSTLKAKKREGFIREFVCGSDFSPFSAETRTILAAEPSLSKDRDYSRGNDGITIVLL